MDATSSAGRGSTEREELVDALVQAGFLTTAVLTRVGAEHDLSLTQLRVLAILRDRRLRMSDLADYLGLERSTMSGLIDRAQQRGLLARATSATDGRVVDVLLTARGTELAEQLFAQITDALLPVIGSLGRAEQRRLTRLLTMMLTAHVMRHHDATR